MKNNKHVKNNKHTKNSKHVKNKRVSLPWLIASIILIIFSIGVLVYAFTNHGCSSCEGKKVGAFIGIFLGIITLIVSCFHNGNNRPQKTSRNNNENPGLLIFGTLLTIISIIITATGLGTLTGGILVLSFVAPKIFAGILITGLGIYDLKEQQKSNGISHPVIASFFIIGIVDMIFFISI